MDMFRAQFIAEQQRAAEAAEQRGRMGLLAQVDLDGHGKHPENAEVLNQTLRTLRAENSELHAQQRAAEAAEQQAEQQRAAGEQQGRTNLLNNIDLDGQGKHPESSDVLNQTLSELRKTIVELQAENAELKCKLADASGENNENEED